MKGPLVYLVWLLTSSIECVLQRRNHQFTQCETVDNTRLHDISGISRVRQRSEQSCMARYVASYDSQNIPSRIWTLFPFDYISFWCRIGILSITEFSSPDCRHRCEHGTDNKPAVRTFLYVNTYAYHQQANSEVAEVFQHDWTVEHKIRLSEWIVYKAIYPKGWCGQMYWTDRVQSRRGNNGLLMYCDSTQCRDGSLWTQ